MSAPETEPETVGPILTVEERKLDPLQYGSTARSWMVTVQTPTGSRFYRLVAHEPETIAPQVGETLQRAVFGHRVVTYFISGRRFSQWRDPHVMG